MLRLGGEAKRIAGAPIDMAKRRFACGENVPSILRSRALVSLRRTRSSWCLRWGIRIGQTAAVVHTNPTAAGTAASRTRPIARITIPVAARATTVLIASDQGDGRAENDECLFHKRFLDLVLIGAKGFASPRRERSAGTMPAAIPS